MTDSTLNKNSVINISINDIALMICYSALSQWLDDDETLMSVVRMQWHQYVPTAISMVEGLMQSDAMDEVKNSGGKLH